MHLARTGLAQAVGGDVRKALGAVELLVSGAGENGITLADAQQAAQRSNMRYDRDGDSHYDILSALQKHNYNRTLTAEALNISRKTLFNKMKRYNLGNE